MYVLAVNDVVQKYPYSTGELRATYPNTSFPSPIGNALLAEFDVYPVTPVSPPACDKITESQEEIDPVLTNGVWMQTWTIRPATADEQAQRIQNLQNDVVSQTQDRLDAFAQTRSYDGILSLCTYATSPTVKFATEGQYGVEARDATWAKLYEILAEVQAGTRPMPSGFAEIKAELPVLEWPNP